MFGNCLNLMMGVAERSENVWNKAIMHTSHIQGRGPGSCQSPKWEGPNKIEGMPYRCGIGTHGILMVLRQPARRNTIRMPFRTKGRARLAHAVTDRYDVIKGLPTNSGNRLSYSRYTMPVAMECLGSLRLDRSDKSAGELLNHLCLLHIVEPGRPSGQ